MRSPILRKVTEKKRKDGAIVGYTLTVPPEFVEILKKKNTRFVVTAVEGEKLIVRPATSEEVARYLAGW